MGLDPNNLGLLNQLQAAQVLAQSGALSNTLNQRFALQDQVLERMKNMPASTNFLGDLGTEFVDQASFNILDRPSGGGVGSTLGRVGGGLANAATILGALGLTGLAPEIALPVGLGVAGALGGGSLEARQQFNETGTISNPAAVLGQGAIEGALNLIPGSKAASFLRRAATDVPLMAGAGLVGDLASQGIKGQPFNLGELGAAGGMSAGMGVLQALLGGPKAGVQSVNQDNPLLKPGAPIDPNNPMMVDARAQLAQNVARTQLPPGVNLDPRIGNGPALNAIDQQLQTLLGKTVDDIPAVRDVNAGIKAVTEPEVPAPKTPVPGKDGYINPETINSPIDQIFAGKQAAYRGAKALGLTRDDVVPVQTGKSEWRLHVPEAVPSASKPEAKPTQVVQEQPKYVAFEETITGEKLYPIGSSRVTGREPQVLQEVNIDDLHSSQSEIFEEGVGKYLRNEIKNGSPSIRNENGKLVIQDGHHRIEAARRLGKKTISAWVEVPVDQAVKKDVWQEARNRALDNPEIDIESSAAIKAETERQYVEILKEKGVLKTPKDIAPNPGQVDGVVPLSSAPVSGVGKPASVVNALDGLGESTTVHDFDLTTVEPGTKIDGLGTFKGFDDAGAPIVSRSGGLKRPGESGFAHDEESLPALLQQANDVLQPGDEQMLREIVQDVQTGQATQFVGRAKQGRSVNLADSANTPGTLDAYGTKTNDRVIGVYYKPATQKTAAQVVARVVNELGEQSTRIIREAGDDSVGFIRTGSAPRVAMHSPATIATMKRALASDIEITRAANVRKAAMGTKHESNPIVQRIDEAINANNPEKLQQALRDFDRLPAEIQTALTKEAGCVK